MATFNITVNGVSGPPFLQVFTEADTGCATVYNIFVTASNGDSITFSLANGGYTDYTCQLDTGSGFISASQTSISFTYGSQATLKVSMLNSNTATTHNITVTGTNNTNSITQDEIISRVSTGTPC